MYIYICIHTYIYIYIYTYLSLYIYIYIYMEDLNEIQLLLDYKKSAQARQSNRKAL